MKKFIKNIILFLVVVIVLGGLGAGIYFFSPEIKPGEAGLLYKVVGDNKGFTGKVLTPGKYYCFITDFNPLIHKIYKIKLYAKDIELKYTSIEGIGFSLNVLYEVDEKNISNFVTRVNLGEDSKIVSLYINSDLKDILADCSINEIFSKNFQRELKKKLTNKINNDLKYFGIKINKIVFKEITPSDNLKNIYAKIKEQEKQLAIVKMETEQKLKEAKLKNSIKEENLNFLLKKAEAEKQIVKSKIEAEKLIREESKKRLLEEVEIFSKPGGALAAKLEAIRVLSKSYKSPEKILNKVNNVFK